ncbi:serine/threonine-protein kinase [Actinocorallia sp. B10E7]|uniref:serine/threonine protein kinase n=1 Tax=Actinocorallia sp. B10E7 TaxID=3153558 RepID=UPI00325CE3D0
MPEAEPLRPGDPVQLGHYRLLGRLGEGGQGVVYLALANAREQVALKLLHTRFTDNPQARQAFARELAAAQKVDPFCTARVLAADVEGDVPYIVSEYIDGLSLERMVQKWGPRTGTHLHRLAIGTATALVAIHKAGVVHRDFKPSNVLLGPDGPRVIDFGVARALDLTTGLSSGGPLGTPAYMAPEQFSRTPVDTSVDVFAWASTLVYASCGEPPFGDDSISTVINRILHVDPDLGGLTGRLRELAAACLAKNPAERPTAEQLLLDLIGTGERELPVAPPRAAAVSLYGSAPQTTQTTRSPGSDPTVSRAEIRAVQRARKRSGMARAGLLVLTGALVGVLGLGAVMAWPSGGGQKPGPQQTVMGTSTATTSAMPKLGPLMELRSTDGYDYTIAAVEGGTEESGGEKYAYIDYMLANTQQQPVPLETPGDLFIDPDKAPKGAPCAEQPGAPADRCTVENTTSVKAVLGESDPLVMIDGEENMAAGSSYLLRVRTKNPVPEEVAAGDLGLYVWEVRFVADRKARHVEFPE